MIYKKSEIDMSLVTCPYEEQKGYISIEDDYTNNVLRLAGYSDISRGDFIDLCVDKILVDKLLPYALKSPEYCYLYARDVIEGRFELGEPAIATVAAFSCWYARDALNGRFELGEPVIATVADYSCWYAHDTLKSRFELGEPVIATNVYYSFKYAYYVLEGRFELGEPAIATNKNYKKQYEERFGVNL